MAAASGNNNDDEMEWSEEQTAPPAPTRSSSVPYHWAVPRWASSAYRNRIIQRDQYERQLNRPGAGRVAYGGLTARDSVGYHMGRRLYEQLDPVLAEPFSAIGRGMRDNLDHRLLNRPQAYPSHTIQLDERFRADPRANPNHPERMTTEEWNAELENYRHIVPEVAPAGSAVMPDTRSVGVRLHSMPALSTPTMRADVSRVTAAANQPRPFDTLGGHAHDYIVMPTRPPHPLWPTRADFSTPPPPPSSSSSSSASTSSSHGGLLGSRPQPNNSLKRPRGG